MSRLSIVAGAILLSSCAGQAIERAPDAWDAAARGAMASAGARGMALAVIEQGEPVFVRAYGERNVRGDPLTNDTIMYGASLTKTAFAMVVMQLVDEGKLDLDRPIAAMLHKPLPDYGNLDAYGAWGDLAGDERWRAITPRILLTHSSGFANFSWVEPNGKLSIHFDPGTRYSYSGEGIMLLQFALKKGLGLDMRAEMQRRLFAPLGMTNSDVMWRPGFAANLADGWKADGSVEPHDERSKVRLAGSMDTSIDDMAKFAAGLVRGQGLSATARAELVRPQLPITSRSQFPTLAPELPPAKRWPGLAAGLGLVSFSGPQGRGFFKGGHNDSTGNMLVCLERRQRCVVILANDVRAEKAIPALVEQILGPTGLPWAWEYGSAN
jgi:CubicO group peptidase (beta-lactamase class C family)